MWTCADYDNLESGEIKEKIEPPQYPRRDSISKWLTDRKQAISIAHADNRSVKNAQLVALIDEDQIGETRTHRFPSINLSALGSLLLTPVGFHFSARGVGSFAGTGPVPATDTRIHKPLRPTLYGLTQFSQPLSQQYKIGLNIKQALLAKLVDEQKLRAQKQSHETSDGPRKPTVRELPQRRGNRGQLRLVAVNK
jgi:hypothetical protein